MSHFHVALSNRKCDMNTIADRLKRARAFFALNQKEFASICGVGFSTYQKYEMGLSLPGAEAMAGFAKVKINTNWLLTDEGDMMVDIENAPPMASELSVSPYIEDQYVSIDKYVNVSGSAGPGTEIHEEAVVKVRVDARLLRERVGSSFSNIKIASVSGDSMDPTLSHGDQVLIDTSCSRFIDDAIYAIQQDGHLRFKRIHLKMDGSIVVRSDGSPNIETYSAEEAQRFFVVGIVIPFKFGRFKV